MASNYPYQPPPHRPTNQFLRAIVTATLIIISVCCMVMLVTVLTGHNQDKSSPLENDISEIRSRYYATQENLENYTKSKDENDFVYYYNQDNQPVRIDGPKTPVISYNKQYFFDDKNNLYFAFVFDGKLENRFYFKGNTLIRWIDEQGNTHDEERTNPSFTRWESNILNETSIL